MTAHTSSNKQSETLNSSGIQQPEKNDSLDRHTESDQFKKFLKELKDSFQLHGSPEPTEKELELLKSTFNNDAVKSVTKGNHLEKLQSLFGVLTGLAASTPIEKLAAAIERPNHI